MLSCKVDRLCASAKYLRSTDLDTVVDNVRNLLARCEVQCGTGCTRSHVLLKSLGDILMISGRYDEVEEAGYQLMFRANDIGDAQLW